MAVDIVQLEIIEWFSRGMASHLRETDTEKYSNCKKCNQILHNKNCGGIVVHGIVCIKCFLKGR